jgi:3-oxoacyl-[acyl-carrier-protein] synthase II
MRSTGVIITGRGAVSAHGVGVHALRDALMSGREGIDAIRRFETANFGVRTGATVPEFAGSDFAAWSSEELCVAFARAAAREAWLDAGFEFPPADPTRVALVNGTTFGGPDGGIPKVTTAVAKHLGIEGPQLTVCTACSSSTNAIGVGRELLLDGIADVVVAGGVDALFAEVFAGFHALGVLNRERCSPFSQSIGTSLGEGAGFLILESRTHANQRGMRSGLSITGFGSSGDAYHETTSDPTGSGVARALRGAIADAGLAPEKIGYVKAHGTGTAANDPAEWRGIQTALGAHAEQVPVSSLKASIGHGQAAAGALECIGTAEGMDRGVLFPTMHFSAPRRDCPTDPLGDAEPRIQEIDHAVCLNSAFGGSNAALVLSRDAAEFERERRIVRILGIGCVTPFGAGLTGSGVGGAAIEPELADLVPSADPRGLDPAARYLTEAAALALQDADLVPRGKLRDQIGLFVGMTRPSTESMQAFSDSIEERGLEKLSANAFSRVVVNASGGSCSKFLGLRGPHLTMSSGLGSGLTALVLAAQSLAMRNDASYMVAAGVDELLGTKSSTAESEGAGCLLLGAGDESKDGIVVRGWGIAAAMTPDRAIESALARARLSRDSIDLVSVCGSNVLDGFEGIAVVTLPTILANAESASGSWGCVQAFNALRNGEARTALVVSDEGGSLSAAVVLEKEDSNVN